MLARELGPKKIRVNALNPGFVVTEGTHSGGLAGSDFEAGAIAQTPLGRAGRPEDIASAAVFLASDELSVAHRRPGCRERGPSITARPCVRGHTAGATG